MFTFLMDNEGKPIRNRTRLVMVPVCDNLRPDSDISF